MILTYHQLENKEEIEPAQQNLAKDDKKPEANEPRLAKSESYE